MNQPPQLTQDKVKECIEHDIIIALYNKNLHNPILLKNLESEYKSKFDAILNADNAKKVFARPDTHYISENFDDFSKFYLDTTKKLCETLGLNFVLDPKRTHSFQTNDFVVSTEFIKSNAIPSHVAGFTILQYNSSDKNFGPSLVNQLMEVHSETKAHKNQFVLVSNEMPKSLYFSIKLNTVQVESLPKQSLTKESVLKNIKSISKNFPDTSTNDLKLKAFS